MPNLSRSLALLITALLLGCSASTIREAPEASRFVSVDGRHFYLNNKPYYFAGTNFWYGAYLGAPGDLGDRERLTRELDLLKDKGITNLRILAASERSDLTMAVRPAFVERPGQYNETLLEGLDFLLKEMAARDMKAVLYLNNFWQWSGGMSQYVSWFTGEPVFDPDVTGQWNAFMENSARFYRMEDAQKAYRDLIKKIVTRTNSLTGTPYNQDPTIMSWQLANEPRPGSDAEGQRHFRAFADWVHDTAGYIKSLAPHQLVSTGSEGYMGSLQDYDNYIIAHMTPNVDYLTFHLWLKNWGWFDAQNPKATYASAMNKARQYIDRHVAIANKMSKPIVLSEFGAERDAGAFDTAAETRYRDRIYGEIFEQIYRHAAACDAIAGSNFWTWGGYGRAQNDDYIWREGDDFTGDPPQEPQGLNSVFNTDTSTLEIIEQHARRMQRLRDQNNN